MDQSKELKFLRSSRLTHASDFKQVFSSNFRVNDNCITLLVSKKKGQNPRIGFAVAKKQVKRAVDRNQIKRLFRESFRQNQYDLPPVDIVVMVRYAILGISRQELVVRINKHWQTIIKKCENC